MHLYNFQDRFPSGTTLLCLHAFIGYPYSQVYYSVLEMPFFGLLLLSERILFLVTAVYLVAQYARYEMRRMEAVMTLNLMLLFIVIFNNMRMCGPFNSLYKNIQLCSKMNFDGVETNLLPHLSSYRIAMHLY